MFYDKFMYLCKQKGVAPSRAATDAGISRSLVTKWRTTNIKTPSPEVLEKLSKYFCVPISELLNEDEQKNEQSTIYDGLSDIKKEFIQFADELTDEQALLALRVLKSIVGEP